VVEQLLDQMSSMNPVAPVTKYDMPATLLAVASSRHAPRIISGPTDRAVTAYRQNNSITPTVSGVVRGRPRFVGPRRTVDSGQLGERQACDQIPLAAAARSLCGVRPWRACRNNAASADSGAAPILHDGGVWRLAVQDQQRRRQTDAARRSSTTSTPTDVTAVVHVGDIHPEADL
jgi:hypothetical protein